MKNNKRNIILVIFIAVLIIIGIFSIIKLAFFKGESLTKPLASIKEYYNNNSSNTFAEATTIATSNEQTTAIIPTSSEDETVTEDEAESEIIAAPEIKEDGSIIYDGMTITELTDKLNKSLTGHLTNTGYYFAKYTKDTGINPYLTVAIVLLETGCNWQCSTIMVECNNIGGLKGHGSCGGTGYSKYDTLEEGIDSYLDIIYNGYYLQGLDTPEKMGPRYAASGEWANKVNNYMNSIKAK